MNWALIAAIIAITANGPRAVHNTKVGMKQAICIVKTHHKCKEKK